MTSKQRRRAKKRPGRKLMGVDLGERRIGVAVSDDTGLIASPLEIVDLKRDTLKRIADLARDHRVEGIVVGMPTTMEGKEGFQARETRQMASELEEHLEIPLVFWDERLTSAIADQIISQNRRKKRNPKQHRDSIAAAVMLQGFLDAYPVTTEEFAAGGL